MGKVIYLFFCMIFVSSFSSAQLKPEQVKFDLLKKPSGPYVSKLPVPAFSMTVQPNFYSSNLSFFCEKELKLEKRTGIPFKFRLGSVQYVDYLEGKKGAGILQP